MVAETQIIDAERNVIEKARLVRNAAGRVQWAQDDNDTTGVQRRMEMLMATVRQLLDAVNELESVEIELGIEQC